MNAELFREVFGAAEYFESSDEYLVMLTLAYLCKPGQRQCSPSLKRLVKASEIIRRAAQKMVNLKATNVDSLIEELSRET